jgi:hypothetical protein
MNLPFILPPRDRFTDRERRAMHVRRDHVRLAQRSAAPHRFVAIVDQNRAATCTSAGFHIVEDVADEPASFKRQVVLARGTQQNARRGLAAIAGAVVRRDRAPRVMRTPVHTR